MKTKFQKPFSFLSFILFFSFLFTTNSHATARIISLKPNITQSLIALGEGQSLIGVTKFCPKPNDNAKMIADYKSIHTEEILRLKPDIIFSSKENSQSRQYELLQQAGLKVVLLNFQTYHDLLASLQTIGKTLGKEKQALEMIESLKQKMSQIKETLKFAEGKTFTIIVQRQPLMIASGKTYLSSLLQELGLKNSFSQNQIPYPVIDEEVFIREDSDFVFALVHQDSGEKEFLNKTVVSLPIEEFLATPQSIKNAKKIPPLIKTIQTKSLE